MQTADWWCLDCHAARTLDRHGRCSCCQSDSVDVLLRPAVTASALITTYISPVEVDRLLIDIAGAVRQGDNDNENN